MKDLDSANIVKLCQLYMVDYCCFDLEMPQICIQAASNAATMLSRNDQIDFENTKQVCEFFPISSQWSQQSLLNKHSNDSYFRTLPSPLIPPHMYARAANVVRSHRKALS